ncbi:MAG: hypothetical protein ABIJ27_00185 [Candidatus Omnitrophota bacterium]
MDNFRHDENTEKAPGGNTFGRSQNRIKIKIKEKIARKSRFRATILLKVFIVIMAALCGYIVGGKTITRYLRYWMNPQIKYHSSEDGSPTRVRSQMKF